MGHLVRGGDPQTTNCFAKSVVLTYQRSSRGTEFAEPKTVWAEKRCSLKLDEAADHWTARRAAR